MHQELTEISIIATVECSWQFDLQTEAVQVLYVSCYEQLSNMTIIVCSAEGSSADA